ncbi:MAG: hypothetical protein AAB386_00945 [Patescibacteria group bacterium]
MSTKCLESNTATHAELASEVKRLRSVVIGLVGRDKEGAYRPAYVRRLLKIAAIPATHTFKDSETFLRELSGIV